MATKYVHARMPGRQLIHLVPAGDLKIDQRFGEDEFLEGWARALCGKKSKGWIWGSGVGDRCERCHEKR